ncbi:hypothetical protein [Bradyrhizobium sp. 174]|uniref:plasmid pRiA4b ORF-3 family protein n=1 Tax=Bradyrhizobium sp. 174 TaxID=2782645 RepID=UPI0031F6D706
MLEAAGRCPPEDVGGAPGYAEYLDAISDPAHPEHEHMRRWGPERFDPNVIDRKASRPPSTRCPTHGNRGDAPREQNRRQAPFKRAAELRLLLTNLVRHYASRDASLKGIKSMSGNSVTIGFRPEHGRRQPVRRMHCSRFSGLLPAQKPAADRRAA